MASARAMLQNRRVNSLPIVADPQPEQTVSYWIAASIRLAQAVLESVSQYLARNPVDLVLKQRRQGSRLPFQDHLENGRMTVPILGVPEFLTRGGEQVFQAPLSRPQAQVLNGIAALGDSLVSLADGAVKRADGLFGAPGEQVARRLEGEHQPLKTLQQRVVQFARDTRPLLDALLHAHVERPLELPETELVAIHSSARKVVAQRA